MPYSGDRGRNIKKFIVRMDLKCQMNNETRFRISANDLCQAAALNAVTGISNLMYKIMVGICRISVGYNHFSNPGIVIE